MTGRGRHSDAISATELMTQLQNDPECQKKIRAAEEKRRERVSENSVGPNYRSLRVFVLLG